MNLFKETHFSLQVFAWVFYIGGALFALWDNYVAIQTFGFDPIWDTLYTILALLYLGAGLYFVFNVRSLLPKHRVRVLQLVSFFFALEIISSLRSLYIVLVNPAVMGPEAVAEFASDPQLYYGTLGGAIVGMAFSFFVYLVIRHAINTVSGMPPKKPAIWMTIVGWAIVALLVGGVLVYASLP